MLKFTIVKLTVGLLLLGLLLGNCRLNEHTSDFALTENVVESSQ